MLCPSATGAADSPVIIGFVGAGGRVANIPTPIPLTEAMRAQIPQRPEAVFRLASPCVQGGCHNWDGRCTLIGRMADRLDASGQAGPAAHSVQPCAIRPDCVWWRQSGPKACHTCTHVSYNPQT